MYCGSCLHDNALARELHRHGVDVQLIPTYTPIRTDEANVAVDRVFFGGVNVYLDQMLPLYQYLPSALVSWLDHPRILQWATGRGIETDASQLGPMCVSMLRGVQGRQRREVLRLANYLRREFRPGLVNFSNILIAGAASTLKRQLGIPVVVTLQGDDIFLEGLPRADRNAALNEIGKLNRFVDRYVTHSRFYADKMADYLGIERAKIRVVPLGVTVDDLITTSESHREDLTIGYLARLAPEKGLHLLCEAVQRLHERDAGLDVKLRIAGWQGPEHRTYAEQAIEKLRSTGAQVLVDGTVDRAQKRTFLSQVDVLCVPSPYEEPKGIYVLEALAAGVPVVSPNHGAFPELDSDIGGMALFPPNDLPVLTEVLADLLRDDSRRRALGMAGQAAVRKRRTSDHAAMAMLDVYQQLL